MEVIYDNPDEGIADDSEPEAIQRQPNDPKVLHHTAQPHQNHQQLPRQLQQKKEPQPQVHQNNQKQLHTHPQLHNQQFQQQPISGISRSDTKRRSVLKSPSSPRRLPTPSSVDGDLRTPNSRRRTQSCSSPPCHKQGSPRSAMRGWSPRQLDAPSSATSVTSSRSSHGVPQLSRSHHRSTVCGGRRLSPATLEAAKLAVAARAAYAKHRPSRAIDKAAFFIVTSEGEQRLDCQEMEELLSRSSRRSWRGHRRRSGSRQSVEPETPTGGGGVVRTPSRTSGLTDTAEHPVAGGRRSPLMTASISSGSYNNSPKRAPRLKRFSSSVSSADALSVHSTSLLPQVHGAREHFQKVRFHSFSHGSSLVDVKSIKSAADRTSLTSLAERKEQRVGKFGHDAATDKPSVLKFAIAGVVMLAGTCAFLLSYVFGRGEAWTLAGSTVMGIGSLLLVLGVCWYLSSTTADGEGTGRLEIRVVDQTQLAQLVKQGVCVQTVTMQTC